MIHAYDKLYLSVAQKNLACMLDYMVNDLKRPLETVWQWFCMSLILFFCSVHDSSASNL